MHTDRKQLICLPIEPLSERYTEQWYRRIPEALSKAGFDVFIINGEPLLEDDIKVGTFLDINSTCHYKSTQLQYLAGMFNRGEVEDGAIIFVFDTEFWGLEQIRLMAQMNKVKVHLVSFLHAASYTKGDAFEVAAPYQQYTEVGWIAACDKVFVGSLYHKKAVMTRRLAPLNALHLADRIKVTKNPIFLSEYQKLGKLIPKQKKILLTNRLDTEKNPIVTIDLFRDLKKQFPEWQFVITSSRKTLRSNDDAVVRQALLAQEDGVLDIKVNLTKQQYHEELASAVMMVSHSREENYGYCIAEAMIYGCAPVLTDAASHPEFVSSKWLFRDMGHDTMIRHMRAYEENPFYFMEEMDDLDTDGMRNIIHELRTL
ncbi:hypothetical protein [Burkholderia phage BCSR5]|nr:hypothetical protein [Burkholderia phage BCSR5]